MHFSHLKEHLPCREKTKKRKTINKKREGRGERKENVILNLFKVYESYIHRAKKQTMQPHRTDERQVYGVEGGGGGNGQDETSVMILTKQTKLITVTKS